MTYADIMLQILSEVSPDPKEKLIEKLEFIKKLAPDSKLDKELTDTEAEILLKKLRQEKAGILAWLIKGSLEKPPFDA